MSTLSDDAHRATVRKLRSQLAAEREKLAEVRAFAERLQADTERYTIWAGDMLMDVLDRRTTNAIEDQAPFMCFHYEPE